MHESHTLDLYCSCQFVNYSLKRNTIDKSFETTYMVEMLIHSAHLISFILPPFVDILTSLDKMSLGGVF